MKGLKIIALTNGTASHMWRFDGIAERMNTQGHEFLITSHQNWHGETYGADIVIAQMFRNPEFPEMCRRRGAKVIYESDDLIEHPTDRKYLMELAPEQERLSIDTVRNCDAVTVTTEPLREHYRRFNPNVYLLPNYFNFNFFGKPSKVERVTDEIRIGWHGGFSHYEDLKNVLVKPLKKVLKRYPKARFIYTGFGGMSSKSLATEIGWGEDCFKELPRERREYVVGVPEDVWADKLKTLDLDIGLCPLIDDEFNRAKSNIKWQEFAFLSVPTVCSPIVYGEAVENNKTGLIAKTEEEWVDAISALIEDSELRRTIGRDANIELKMKYDLDLHWKKWLSVYQDVLEGGELLEV